MLSFPDKNRVRYKPLKEKIQNNSMTSMGWNYVSELRPPPGDMNKDNNGGMISTGEKSWFVHQRFYQQSNLVVTQEELAKKIMNFTLRGISFTSKNSLTCSIHWITKNKFTWKPCVCICGKRTLRAESIQRNKECILKSRAPNFALLSAVWEIDSMLLQTSFYFRLELISF
jgi:hypothetical protein